MLREGRTDKELLEILEVVHLAYIPDREGGWETKKEWKDVFSGGEKQRVGGSQYFEIRDDRYLFNIFFFFIHFLDGYGTHVLPSTQVCGFGRMYKCCVY